MTIHLWRMASFNPCSQPWPSVPVSEIDVFRRSKSTISGSANMPRPTITIGIPSLRYPESNVIRNSPVAGAAPILPISNPTPQVVSPFNALVPVSMPIMLSAKTISRSCSPNPIAKMIGRAAKTAPVKIMAPKIPPNREAEKAAPRARAPSPRLANGNPSTTVACDPAVPGIPISTEGKVSEVTVGANNPIIIDKACDSSMPKTNGRTIDRPAIPPSPGKMPTRSPRIVPSMRKNRCAGVNISTSA